MEEGGAQRRMRACEEARQHAAAALRLTPNLTISKFLRKDPYRRREDAEHAAEGLRKAGIPE
jgi:hypothetical protein